MHDRHNFVPNIKIVIMLKLFYFLNSNYLLQFIKVKFLLLNLNKIDKRKYVYYCIIITTTTNYYYYNEGI